MPSKMYNRARMTVTSTGTGNLSLGVAVAGYQTFSSSGAQNGDTVSYTIEDGVNWEVGTGTFNSVAGTLSRTVTQSYNGTSYGTTAISVTTSAQVYITALAADIVVNGGPLGTPSSGTLTNATGLPLTTGVTGTLPVANGGTGITSFGTGVATALGVNTGSAGAFVVNGGALGTPSSGTLTNATGLPISTGVSGLGTGVATFLGTPTSANLAAAVTDETGTGALVFASSPIIATPTLSTSFTSPLHIGGTTASSTLTLQSTSGVGTSDSIVFKVGNNGATTAATFDTNGSLLVGLSSTLDSNSKAQFQNLGTSKNAYYAINDDAAANNSICWNQATSGDNRFIAFVTETSYNERGRIYYDRVAGKTKLADTSDRRLKKDISDAPSLLDAVNNIKVRQYAWKETGNVNIGFIAQELIDVVPRAVSEGQDAEDGSIKSPWCVDGVTLIPYLTKAVQELAAKVSELEAKQ